MSPKRAAMLVVVTSLLLATAAVGEESTTDPVPAKKPVQSTRIVGVVVDREGKPIPEAWITVSDHNGRLPRKHDEPKSTGADGRFLYDDLSPRGRFEFCVVAAGYAWARTDRIAPQEEDVRITLVPARTFTGSVVDAEGWPIPDLAVKLLLDEALYPERATTGGTGRSDSAGWASRPASWW
jgi:hypothetical protein